MKSLSAAAMLLISGVAMAQTEAWYAQRFGFNAPAPDLFGYQTSSDYKNFVFNDGKASARWNNSTAVMTGTGVAQVTTGRTWSDPANHLWTDLYEMTDLLPKNTWVRVTANLSNRFPDPFNPKGHGNAARDYSAIISRIMFRGTDLSNGLNLLWNVTPGVAPSNATADSWSNITVNPWGSTLNTAIQTGDPAKRDWWRPYTQYYPYLRNHVQNFVYDVNDYAATVVRARTGTGDMTENFVARMGFQMGNEPAGGHPGGSIDGAVGSWQGVGSVLEATMAGIDYQPYKSYKTNYGVPDTFGTNPITMPAFSMFSENVDSYHINYVKGQLRNIQWGGNLAPALNEISSYSKEMQGKNWPTYCGRRALHFNSPIYRWRFTALNPYSSPNADDQLTSSPINASMGRWETPQEYAKRWVAELNKQVELVANLQMPGNSNIVDVTECYFTGAQSGGIKLDPTATLENGSLPNYQGMTMDQLRSFSRSYMMQGGYLTPLTQLPASRESILAAIRTELYNQDMAGTLSSHLGRIYWWGGYYTDPRTETGVYTDDSNNVNGYFPWSDYRLTLSEVKALWGRS
ncbi:MAG: hypothetical protein JST12_02940 [Armatimonadetes bacterium]|nr:hypothetical protein [Armatimonadota bacterium]MBS1728924.1 hypothetical protein [Armatimonadota bacterium]